jgi:hypothetical protein
MDGWERRLAKSPAFDGLDRLDERLGLDRPPKNRRARWVRYGGVFGPLLGAIIAAIALAVVHGDAGYFGLLIIPALAYALVFGLGRLPRRRS